MRKHRHRQNQELTEDLNVWPSFTDLMANAFMIISLFLLLALFKSLFLKSAFEESELNLSESEQQIQLLQEQLATLENNLGESTDIVKQLKQGSSRLQLLLNRNKRLLRQSNSRVNLLETQIQQSNSQVNILESEVERLKSAPPVVVIQDSGEYQFSSGSAELPAGLESYITEDLVERIEEISQTRNLYVVEIIGHTDGQVNINSNSNLDRQLEAVANGDRSISSLSAGSNADLGLMRALEVVKKLQETQQKGRLQGVQFRAYSAAQLLLPSGEFSTVSREPDAGRRRIEIRFSPLGKAETIR
ncbi:MAG: flagellar motor protein [Xenococcaceae cyanobacterium]